MQWLIFPGEYDQGTGADHFTCYTKIIDIETILTCLDDPCVSEVIILILENRRVIGYLGINILYCIFIPFHKHQI